MAFPRPSRVALCRSLFDSSCTYYCKRAFPGEHISRPMNNEHSNGTCPHTYIICFQSSPMNGCYYSGATTLSEVQPGRPISCWPIMGCADENSRYKTAFSSASCERTNTCHYKKQNIEQGSSRSGLVVDRHFLRTSWKASLPSRNQRGESKPRTYWAAKPRIYWVSALTKTQVVLLERVEII